MFAIGIETVIQCDYRFGLVIKLVSDSYRVTCL